MEFSQDILLPILLATIIANTAIVLILLALSRSGRRKRVATAGDHAPEFDEALMSTSYKDQTVPAAWMTGDAADRPDANEPEADASAGRPTDGQVDALTGLPVGSVFSLLVADEDARIARYHHAATVVVLELEGYDRFVERLGEEAGDRIVPAVADTLRRLAREADQVARLGPGRFACLMPETDEIAAINYVERVRRACDLWLESGAIALRLAIGWAGTSGDPSLADCQRIATDRMFVELRRGARSAGTTDEAVDEA